MNALKYLPWRSLFLAAILAVVVMKALDFIVGQGAIQLGLSSAFMKLLFTPAGGILLFLSGGLAVGGLGVLFLEQFGQVGPIDVSTLWALVVCLWLCLWLAAQLPVTGLGLAEFSQAHAISAVLGVFWRGRPYWH